MVTPDKLFVLLFQITAVEVAGPSIALASAFSSQLNNILNLEI